MQQCISQKILNTMSLCSLFTQREMDVCASSLLRPVLMFIVRLRPVVAVVIMTDLKSGDVGLNSEKVDGSNTHGTFTRETTVLVHVPY